MNLFDWFREEASKKGLLGNSYAGGSEFTIKGTRPTFEEATQAKKNTIEFGLCRTSQASNEHIVQGIEDLASGKLKNAELAFFLLSIEPIANGYYAEGTFQKTGKIPNVNDKTQKIAEIAYSMSYAIAFLEGNLPPNDLGYIPDQSVSLVRKDEISLDSLERANSYINAYPNIFDGYSINITEMFNKIASRLEKNRPTFCSKLVRPDVNVKRR